MNWGIKGGVIIIGSLLWQNYLNDENDNKRLEWRNSRLDIENKIPIRIPIRYGRKSSSKIITMVFSNRMSRKKGVGYVVPLNKTINNSEELLSECKALSKAEGLNGKFVAFWGVIAYLLNEEVIEGNVKKEIVKIFKQSKNEQIDILDYKVGRERSCVTNSLKLNINWVDPIIESDKNKLDKLHFLLATPTKPMNSIPTYEEIANSVKSDTQRKYFMNNLINGIITFDDFKILKYL